MRVHFRALFADQDFAAVQVEARDVGAFPGLVLPSTLAKKHRIPDMVVFGIEPLKAREAGRKTDL